MGCILGRAKGRFGRDDVSEEAIAIADSWCDDVSSRVLPQIHKAFGPIQLMVRASGAPLTQIVMLIQYYQSARGHHVPAWIMVGNAVK